MEEMGVWGGGGGEGGGRRGGGGDVEGYRRGVNDTANPLLWRREIGLTSGTNQPYGSNHFQTKMLKRVYSTDVKCPLTTAILCKRL